MRRMILFALLLFCSPAYAQDNAELIEQAKRDIETAIEYNQRALNALNAVDLGAPEWIGSIRAKNGSGAQNGPQIIFDDLTRVKWWSRNWRGVADLFYDATRENADIQWTEPGHILGTLGVQYGPMNAGNGVRLADIPNSARVAWWAEYANGNSAKNYNDIAYWFTGWRPNYDDSGEQNECYILRAYTGTPGDELKGVLIVDGLKYKIYVGRWSPTKPGYRLKAVYDDEQPAPVSIRFKPFIDYWIEQGYISADQYLLYLQVGCEMHNAQDGFWRGRNIKIWKPEQ